MTNEKENNKVTSQKEKHKRLRGIAAFSLLISLFDHLGDLIREALIEGFFGRICTSYTALRKKLSSGFFSTYIIKNGKIRRFFRRIRGFFARNLESCVALSLTTTAIDRLCSFPLQYYGNFGLFFGVYTTVIYCVRYFIPWLDAPATSHLWTGIIVAVVSVPMLFSRINLANSVKNSVFGRGIFKSTFGFSDEAFDSKKNTSRGKGNLMLFFGLLAGISTLVIHPLVIIGVAFAILVITLVAVKPEIGVLITIVSLPFLSFTSIPTICLGAMVLITTFFYLIKLIRGKRIFKLEIVDFVILLFGGLIMLSSAYSAGATSSVLSASMTVILLLGYFLLVNLMRTELWIKRCIIALVTSASVAALIGVFEFVFGAESNNWLDQSFYGIIKTRVVSLFENPNMLAMFLVMTFPFLIALSVRARAKNEKFLINMLMVLFIACIVFTWSRAAWLAIILGLILFAMLYSKKSFRIFGATLIMLPIMPILLPTSIIDRFLSISNLTDSSIAYRIYTWQGTFGAISDYFFCGIGYGDSAFQTVYPKYAYSGIETTPHSHSLVLQILLCMGIVGLVVFALAIFLSFQKSLEYIKTENNVKSSIYVIAVIVSIVSALIIGVFDYIWYNPRIFYLFWIIVAMGGAFVRVGDSERARCEDFEHDLC